MTTVVTGMGDNTEGAVLVLSNTINSDTLSITTDGTYTFPFSIAEGQAYEVEVSADSIFEAGFSCFTNGGSISGTMSTSDVSFDVTCDGHAQGNKFNYFFLCYPRSVQAPCSTRIFFCFCKSIGKIVFQKFSLKEL